MRDPKRISRIINKLSKLWERHPDQRFGQLLENYVTGTPTASNWFIEDDYWERIIDKQLSRQESPRPNTPAKNRHKRP